MWETSEGYPASIFVILIVTLGQVFVYGILALAILYFAGVTISQELILNLIVMLAILPNVVRMIYIICKCENEAAVPLLLLFVVTVVVLAGLFIVLFNVTDIPTPVLIFIEMSAALISCFSVNAMNRAYLLDGSL